MVLTRRKNESKEAWRIRQEKRLKSQRDAASLSNATRSESASEETRAAHNARNDFERTPRTQRRQQRKRKKLESDNETLGVAESEARNEDQNVACPTDKSEETTNDYYNQEPGPSSRLIPPPSQQAGASRRLFQSEEPGPSSRLLPPSQESESSVASYNQKPGPSTRLLPPPRPRPSRRQEKKKKPPKPPPLRKSLRIAKRTLSPGALHDLVQIRRATTELSAAESPSSSNEHLGRITISQSSVPTPLSTQEERIQKLNLWRINESAVEEHFCGNMDYSCDSCNARHFFGELTDLEQKLVGRVPISVSRCCSGGIVHIPPLPEYPAFLVALLTDNSDEARNFRENIRPVNNAFAFCCMRANIQHFAKGPRSPPQIFVIQGQIYHLAGPLHPDQPDGQRQYAQMYIMDQAEATEQRLKLDMMKRCNRGYVEQLTHFLHENNKFAQSFHMMYQMEQDFKRDNPGLDNNLCMAIYDDRRCDKRNYNKPVGDTEVAIVFDNADGEPPHNWDLIIYPHGTTVTSGPLQVVNYLNPNIEPMSYPLLFPFGDQGWGPYRFFKRLRGRFVSPREYYAYRFSVRKEKPTAAADARLSSPWVGTCDPSLSPQNEDFFEPFLHAGRLTQQYIVDSYVRIEGERLSWIRRNQSELRAESYFGFIDSFGGQGGAAPPANAVGKSIILPSSYNGGPRYMQQRYQDAMAIVARFGKPDLFLTMTCNPKWKEITENLEPHETHLDRPDLVARVFHQKVEALQNEIIKDEIFGRHLASIDVIEFQKRGLPHLHLLIILGQEAKFKTSDDIDRIVCAEIPDNERNPILRKRVLGNMIHMPCGPPHNDKRCRGEAGTEPCKKKFPKAFASNTVQNVNGYPIYRRRPPQAGELPIIVKKSSPIVVVDNSWVVPYNPYLLLKYNCHINVEVCASIHSVKYLFKYVYKGHDAAFVGLHGAAAVERDEIKEYLDARYVSSPESIWRIFGFPMNRHSHVIKRLAVHLPNQQNVVFAPAQMETEEGRVRALEQAAIKETTLTAYFKLNQTDTNARNYTYTEIPEHYIIDPKTGLWKRRVYLSLGNKTIGRMYTVNVRDTERFFLRLLLEHERGSTSFQDLLTVRRTRIGGRSAAPDDDHFHEEEVVHCTTFRQAAVERGYASDDTEWTRLMRNAAIFEMPAQLRMIFAYICTFCGPSEPENLWTTFRKELMEDICHVRGLDLSLDLGNEVEALAHECEQIALDSVRKILIDLGYNWTDLNLPFPQQGFVPPPPPAMMQHDQQHVTSSELINSLNILQRFAFNTVMEAIEEGVTSEKKCFFLDGPGGSGKTYLYKTLIRVLQEKGDSVLSCATTGIAANLLPGGRTMHSLFGLSPNLTKDSTSNIKMNSFAADKLGEASLILMDECTMASAHAVNTIDKLMRDVMAVKKGRPELRQIPFGGKVILFGGDFRQCIAILPRAKEAAIVQASLKYADSWSEFQRLSLRANMRAAGDSRYSNWLLKVGDGAPLYGENALEAGLVRDGDPSNQDLIKIPSNMIEKGTSLVNTIFGEAIANGDYESLSQRAILCPKNQHVDKVNVEVIGKLPGEMKTFYSTDSAQCEDEAERESYPTEFLHSLNPSGMPPHKLCLKVNTIVILLRNLNTQEGLCNGTRLLLINIDMPNVVLARVLTGSAAGTMVLIPKIVLTTSDNTQIPFVLNRIQFPFKPAFAMTINKAQGQTLDMVGILLPEPVFTHGQLYVALSRAKAEDRVKLKILNTLKQGTLIQGYDGVFTRNVVFREILH